MRRAKIRWTITAIAAGALTLGILSTDWTSVVTDMKGDSTAHSHSLVAGQHTKAEARAAMREYGLSVGRAKELAQQYGITKESLQ